MADKRDWVEEVKRRWHNHQPLDFRHIEPLLELVRLADAVKDDVELMIKSIPPAHAAWQCSTELSVCPWHRALSKLYVDCAAYQQKRQEGKP